MSTRTKSNSIGNSLKELGVRLDDFIYFFDDGGGGDDGGGDDDEAAPANTSRNL